MSLSALARNLELRGVYDAENRIKAALRKIIAASVMLGVVSYVTGYYIVMVFIPIVAVMFLASLFTTGRDYGLINRETILFALHGFILSNAGFDVTSIFDNLARIKEYQGSYVFRKIMGMFYFMGMDLKEAINIVLQEERRLGVAFKSFLSSIYNGLVTGIDTQSIFSLIIQQQIIESERDIEKFEDYVNSFLSGLMPVVIMLPIMMALLGGIANLAEVEAYFMNFAFAILIALILLFSENKFLYYPELILLDKRILSIQSVIAAACIASYFLIGFYSFFLANFAFFTVGYAMTRNYIKIRNDTYSYLPVFLADLGGRISIGQTFTEAVANMPMNIYGHFSKVLRYSLGNLIAFGDIPPKRDYDRIFIYKIYKKIIMDLQRGVYGYAALMNIRTIISLMSLAYGKIRSSLTMNSILLSISLSFSILFIDIMGFLGFKVSQAIAQMQQADPTALSGLSGMLSLLSFLAFKPWMINVYAMFAAIFMFVFGMFVTTTCEGSRHGNIHSIIYVVISATLIMLMHELVAPALFKMYI
ncbi:MAG: hypothetical protein QXO55_06170 [Candidatus Korarchaeum sp.]